MNEQTNQNPANSAPRKPAFGRTEPIVKSSRQQFAGGPVNPDKQADAPEEDETNLPLKPQPSDNPPMRAASGNDDIMSQQQGQAMPSTDQLKGKWKQQVGAAKIAWGKLTEDELLKTEGQEQKLAGLVQERYAITRDEADQQIKNFFAKTRH